MTKKQIFFFMFLITDINSSLHCMESNQRHVPSLAEQSFEILIKSIAQSATINETSLHSIALITDTKLSLKNKKEVISTLTTIDKEIPLMPQSEKLYKTIYDTLAKKNSSVSDYIDHLTTKKIKDFENATGSTIDALTNVQNNNVKNTIPLSLQKYILEKAKTDFTLKNGLTSYTLKNTEDITCFYLNKKIKQLATASNNYVNLWDLEKCTHTHTLPHNNDVTCVFYTRDGLLLATATGTTKVQLWDTQTGICTNTLSYEFPIESVSFNFNGSDHFLLAASDCNAGNFVYIYNLTEKKPIAFEFSVPIITLGRFLYVGVNPPTPKSFFFPYHAQSEENNITITKQRDFSETLCAYAQKNSAADKKELIQLIGSDTFAALQNEEKECIEEEIISTIHALDEKFLCEH